MDALVLIPDQTRSDPYWVGSLSMTIALALKASERERKALLKRTLDEFLKTRPRTDELRSMLESA